MSRENLIMIEAVELMMMKLMMTQVILIMKKKQIIRNGKIPVVQVLAEELAEVQALRKSKRVSMNKVIEDSCNFTRGKNLFAKKKYTGSSMGVGQLISVRKKTGVGKK
jgi:hypothetical protein